MRRNGASEELVNRRFWAKVALPQADGCLTWIGAVQGNGYGRFADSTKGKTVLAHRYAYELASGSIPDGMVIDHLCRNRACVNPEHLETVTQRENILRGTSRAAVTRANGVCGRGHQLGEMNRRSDSDGCNVCHRTHQRRRYLEGRLRAAS